MNFSIFCDLFFFKKKIYFTVSLFFFSMRIAIVGAGPAGVFTALLLKNFSGDITLFEKNAQIGEKLKCTGGGRMNISNTEFSHYHFWATNENLLKKLFKNPWMKNRMSIFDSLGMKYFWEENRAILQSENAKQEVFRLENLLQEQKNLHMKMNCTVNHITPFKKGFSLQTSHNTEVFDIIVLCTGGMLRLNHSGEPIYQLVSDVSHTVTPLSPALSPLVFPSPFQYLAGISVCAELFDPISQKKVTGDILFTHKGLSGPAVLDFSLFLEGENAEINFCPSLDQEVFFTEISALRHGKHFVKKFLSQYFPQKLSETLLSLSGISLQCCVADLSKSQISLLCENIFAFKISGISRMDYASSWTTKGGVPLSEIVLHTLESKIHTNLFFAGEVLEVTGKCGGYNISLAGVSAQIVSEVILKCS
jgi:predicted Rossmann fold flavoprotein